ncbi:MAG: RNase P modulator RnpM [Lachnospiraceae bacterium]|jgi:predicted RNA-binding protein YlxR (DUF448 family)
MAAERKPVMRQCVGCGQVREKKDMIRVVRRPDGSAAIDTTGKMNGRGAYLCRNPECLKKAVRKKSLARSLQIEIPEELAERLKGEITNIE